jgi:hypothetical protein
MTLSGCLASDLKKKLEEYKSNSFEWIVDDFSQTKTFKLLVLKNNRSSKIAGGIIENIIIENPNTMIKWL